MKNELSDFFDYGMGPVDQATIEKVSKIIIHFNTLERLMKLIITKYIGPKDKYSFDNFVLNNEIINFANKLKIIEHIIKFKKIKVEKEFLDAMHKCINYRNAVAHSDRLNEIVLIDWETHENGLVLPIIDNNPTVTRIKPNFKEESLEDISKKFSDNYFIAVTSLDKLLNNI